MSNMIKWNTIPEEELIQIYATYQRGYYEDDFRNYFKAVEARLKELNAPVLEQGEPVGWLNNVGFYINNGIKQIRVLRGEPDANDFNIAVYTTPHQAQSVADALEEVAKLCVQPYPNDNEYQKGWNDAEANLEKAIRALIKRNAEGVQ